ncbi:hypothetical protein ACTFIZ_012237 [Dictyostelium cf. discoideum]
MDINEIQRILRFNTYVSNFHNIIYRLAAKLNRIDIISFLMDNFKIDIISFSHVNNYLQMKYIYENHIEKVKNNFELVSEDFDNKNSNIQFTLLNNFIQYICSIRNEVIETVIEKLISEFHNETLEIVKARSNETLPLLIKNQLEKVNPIKLILQKPKTQSFILSKLQDLINKHVKARNSIDCKENYFQQNLFSELFIKGNIKCCDFILKNHPKQIKITKEMLRKTLKHTNFHIIKHYVKIDNCKNLINSINDDQELLEILKDHISDHGNKFIQI